MLRRSKRSDIICVSIIQMELAIPIVALGGLYVISNADGKKEGFVPTKKQEAMHPLPSVDPPSYPINYPVTKKVGPGNVNRYLNPNQATDKYFAQDIYQRVNENKPVDRAGSVGGGTEPVQSLAGGEIDCNNFKHNNMVPFFGGKVRGATADRNVAEPLLDNMQGTGTQFMHKKEVAPLFKPQQSLHYAHGTPNQTDFMLSRQNPSLRVANVKPWDEEKVAPGLGLGYTSSGSGSGYNAAVEARDKWLPKTVNELRVDTNPKMTFGLDGHQGPANAYIKDAGTLETQGKIEKYRPDTDYKVGPQRWFTTTGLEKAQTARGIEVLQEQARPETTREYYGGSGSDGATTYVTGEYAEPHSQQLDGPDFQAVAAPGRGAATSGDHGNGSYTQLCNNRSTVRQPDATGAVHGMIRAVVAPIMDVLRPSRKENFVGNYRPNGNAGTVVSNLPVYNPADRTKTTIKEQTVGKLGSAHVNVQAQNTDGYLVSDHQPVSVNRDTTNCPYSGNAGPVAYGANMTYDAAYKQRNNPNKSYESRPNMGGTNAFNNSQNVSVGRREEDRVNNRAFATSARISASPSMDTYGKINTPQYYDECKSCDRIQPDILTAFKNNPYTQSLNSWA